MKLLVQRVISASVTVEGETVGEIGKGILCYFGLDFTDQEDILIPFLDKLLKLRIFEDEGKKMNLTLKESGGDILFISQFTLSSDIYKGNRPGFETCLNPGKAESLYEKAIEYLRSLGYKVEKGIFGSEMLVSSINDGPCTFMLESQKIKSIRR